MSKRRVTETQAMKILRTTKARMFNVIKSLDIAGYKYRRNCSCVYLYWLDDILKIKARWEARKKAKQ